MQSKKENHADIETLPVTGGARTEVPGIGQTPGRGHHGVAAIPGDKAGILGLPVAGGVTQFNHEIGPDTATLLVIEKLRVQRERILLRLERIEQELHQQIAKINAEEPTGDAVEIQQMS